MKAKDKAFSTGPDAADKEMKTFSVAAEPTDADLILTVPTDAYQIQVEVDAEPGVEVDVKFRKQ